MVQTASLFSQLLHEVPRNEFARLVHTHQGERHAKGFTCWAQFTAMLFCQLAHADSLRQICNGLACCVGKLVHLGITRGPSTSNLSYANVHRPAALFEDLFWTMTRRFRAQSQLGARAHRFRFKNKLLSLDSTTISLCLSLFPWATFRRAKGGVKAHVLLDHDVCPPRVDQGQDARRQSWASCASMPGPSWPWTAPTTTTGIRSLGRRRLLRHAHEGQRRLRRRSSARCRSTATFDPTPSSLTVRPGAEHVSAPAAAIVVWDAENERDIVLLTNHLDFGARPLPPSTRSGGKSSSSSKRQTELTRQERRHDGERATHPDLDSLARSALARGCTTCRKRGGRSPILHSMLRLNLFTYRHLRDWLDDPFNTPPREPVPEQLTLVLS